MALTERQRRLYNSAPVGEIGRVGLTLRHKAFSKDWHLTNFDAAFAGTVLGEPVVFKPHPFKVVLPETSTQGRAELKLDIWDSGPEFEAELMASALMADVPIRCIFAEYLSGDPEPQGAPYVLGITDVSLKDASCGCVATWVDSLNMEFPRFVYTLEKYRGLNRD